MDKIHARFQQLRTRMRERGVSIKATMAEMIGTASFVLIGLLTIVYASEGISDPVVVNFVIAFAFGIGIAAMVYMTSFTSGGHLNPAITCAMVAAGVTTPVQGIAHIIGQVGGGIVATLLLLVIVPGHVLHGKALGANAVPEGVHLLQAFIGEVVGMFIIMLTILEVATHTKSTAGSNAPLAIGLIFTVCILAFSPISSASFNPARSFGPALLSGHLGHLIIYIAGPIAGAMLSVPVHLLSLSEYGSGEQRHEEPSAVQEAAFGTEAVPANIVTDMQEALLSDEGNTA